MLDDMSEQRRQRGERRRPRTFFGGRRERDNLYERSFRACVGCGEDVYVLAIDCRNCGQAVELRAS
jgi:hypothetical protein